LTTSSSYLLNTN